MFGDVSSTTAILWAAVIAGGAGVSGAIAGAVATFRATARAVTGAREEGARQRSHELDMAREDRQFQRRADAYVTVTQHVVWIVAYAAWRKQVGIGWTSRRSAFDRLGVGCGGGG